MTETSVAAPGAEQRPLKGIRRTAARRMVVAWAAPAFHLQVDVDMTAALAGAKQLESATVTDVLLAATAAALVAHPDLNATYADEVVSIYDRVSLGLAVSTDAGLVVPVVHDVDGVDLAEVTAKRRDVVSRARSGDLKIDDVQGGTFTISNLGMLGIDRFDAILNTPQVGILAVGSTVERAIVVDGSVIVRPISTFTLTCDHRAVDGATGAGFLAEVRRQLESGTSPASPEGTHDG